MEVSAITLNCREEAGSEFNSENNSELPVTADAQEITPFQTMPNIKHCEEIMTESQFERFQSIMKENSDLFSKNKTDIGLTTLLKHKIELEPGSKPYKETPRRMNSVKTEAAKETVNDMLQAKLIKESHSPFASGLVVVAKKDGTHRMCIDFRKLNDMTVKDAFPLPRIDKTIESMGSAKWFTSVDMGSAFWQVPLDEESKAKTASATEDGLFECERMPFGLCNATATFQRLMQKALKSISCNYGNVVLCYIDDILVATTTIEQHLERLEEVLRCIRLAGLKLKASKCQFFEKEIIFLGRRTSEGDV